MSFSISYIHINKILSIKLLLFSYPSVKYIFLVLMRNGSMRRFCDVPTTYDLAEKMKEYSGS